MRKQQQNNKKRCGESCQAILVVYAIVYRVVPDLLFRIVSVVVFGDVVYVVFYVFSDAVSHVDYLVVP